MKNRTALLIFFLVISSLSWGQTNSKWAFVGTYRYSTFMYEYSLTLKADSTFEAVESSDQGSEKTTGTWLVMGRKLVMTSTKRSVYNVTSSGQTKREVKNLREKIIAIKEGDGLKLLTGPHDYLKKV